MKSESQSGSDFEQMKKKAKEQFDLAMDKMGQDLVQKQNEVMNGLVSINGFIVPRPVVRYDEDPGAGTAPPVSSYTFGQ